MEKGSTDPSALVLEIMRMSTEDGPGLRTTMFLKGCSLSCRWCQNPESISAKPEVRWIGNRCLGCRECLSACPVSALSCEEGITVRRNLCTGCGSCAEECPASALEVWGRRMTVEEAFKELMKDRAYFGTDGGVTLSGGEATLQAPFVKALFTRLAKEGVHTALDTCGACSTEQLETSCEQADLILYDLKESDEDLHRRYTGGSLKLVVDHFKTVVSLVRSSRLHRQVWPDQREKRLWVRTPVIPGMTARRDNIQGIARIILEHGEGLVDRWELCAFNNLCRDKYRRLGKAWELEEADLLPAEEMDALVQAAVEAGADADLVHWSGMTRNIKE
ncbi:MAG: glycyl-radical enzyme activating protein [Spirochaetales bacterium]|nr:glycyl-radical enzyme activating protein [Spirochaetales bacterium]